MPELSPLSRRTLIGGAGAALGAGLVAVAPSAAEADDASRRLSTSGPIRKATPITSTLASAPVSGWTYRHVSMFDWTPESATANRAFGGFGVHSTVAQTSMWSSVEIPAGALVRDVEWYVHNSTGSTAYVGAWIWKAGVGYYTEQVSSVPVPTGTGVQRARGVLPSTLWGPYPSGTKLNLTLFTPVDGELQINGARVGFSQGSGNVGLQSTSVRAYDSRTTGGKLAANATRTITLPASAVPVGTSAVICSVVLIDQANRGTLKVWSASAGEPPSGVVSYPKDSPAMEQITTTISSARQLKIKANVSTHVVIDVLGTVG